jgi:hypothetical protein
MAWSQAKKHFGTGASGKVEHIYSCAVIQADRHIPLGCGRAAEAFPGLI